MSQLLSYHKDTPSSITQSRGIHLLSYSTPNGQKVQILLEELLATYGLEFTTTHIQLFQGEHKKEWFLQICPNGKIPVLIDGDTVLSESSAILLYLLEKFDRNHTFSFESLQEQAQVLQWLFFWHGSGALNQGQLNHFTQVARQEIPHAIGRFRSETLRVYAFLETHLSGGGGDQGRSDAARSTGRQYFAGNGQGKYSAADMAIWPFVSHCELDGLDVQEMERFPHLREWVERIMKRPAVQAGLSEEKYGPRK